MSRAYTRVEEYCQGTNVVLLEPDAAACFTTRTPSTGPCACSSKSHALKMGDAGGTGAKLKHAGAALERRAPLMLGVSQS